MSKDIDIEKYTSEDITTEKLSELIAKKASFQIVAEGARRATPGPEYRSREVGVEAPMQHHGAGIINRLILFVYDGHCAGGFVLSYLIIRIERGEVMGCTQLNPR